MKNILIIGQNSYIGNSFSKYMKKYDDYSIVKVSSRNNEWEEVDFSLYDVVFNVAGIAHVDTNPRMENLYYDVNRDLPIKIAQKSKGEGVKQFIHMSSSIVYGDTSKMGGKKRITANTHPEPVNFYGKSKLQAENGLKKLRNNEFRVALIRTPLVYSELAKGNFPRLVRIAKILPIFPDVDNEQSMIYIENLCEFIRLIIDNEGDDVFFPQNKEYVKTTDMVKLISKFCGKRILLTKLFNPLLMIFSKRIRIINKAFGSFTYDKSLSDIFNWNYCVIDFEESLERVCKILE